MKSVDYKEIYKIIDYVDLLNKSGLSFFDFFETLSEDEKSESCLSLLASSTNFLINNHSKKYSEYYSSIFLNKIRKPVMLTLFRADGHYNLHLQNFSHLNNSNDVLRNHKITYLNTKFKKNPSLLKFIKSLKIEKISIDKIDSGYEKLMYVLSVLKNKNFNDFFYVNFKNQQGNRFLLSHYLHGFFKNIDKKKNLTDMFIAINKNNCDSSSFHFFSFVDFLFFNFKVNQFIKKEFTQNRKLINNDIYDLIFKIYNSDECFASFSRHILPKISKFKTEKALLDCLSSFFDNYNNWNYSFFYNKLVENKIVFDSSENNILIFKIENYSQAFDYCPPIWCIKDDERSFAIRESEKKEVFIVMNFNLPCTDPKSILGITLDSLGNLFESYDRSNKCKTRSFLAECNYHKIMSFRKKMKWMKLFNNIKTIFTKKDKTLIK